MSGSPYSTDLASQAASIRSAQQLAQLMSVPRVQSSNPYSSLPSSSLTLPSSRYQQYTLPSSSLTLQSETTLPSSSLTLQPETTTPSSSYQQYTLPSSSLEYPSQPLRGQPLSGQPLSFSYILPPLPPPPGSTLTFTSVTVVTVNVGRL